MLSCAIWALFLSIPIQNGINFWWRLLPPLDPPPTQSKDPIFTGSPGRIFSDPRNHVVWLMVWGLGIAVNISRQRTHTLGGEEGKIVAPEESNIRMMLRDDYRWNMMCVDALSRHDAAVWVLSEATITAPARVARSGLRTTQPRSVRALRQMCRLL